MARLMVPGHEGRVFKDELWKHDGSAYGWRSLGDYSEPTARYGDLWAFAVEFDVESESAERAMFDDIVNLRPPFVAAEICRLIDGTHCAIGFYPEPD